MKVLQGCLLALLLIVPTVAQSRFVPYISIWDVETGTNQLIETESPINEVWWTPDESRLLIQRATELMLWNPETSESEFSIQQEDEILGIFWSPNGKYLVSWGNIYLYVYDAQTGETLIETPNIGGNTPRMKWYSDGERFLLLDYDIIYRWEIITGETSIFLNNERNPLRGFDWHPNGVALFVWSQTGIRIIHAETGEETQNILYPDLWTIHYSPDRSQVLLQSNHSLTIIDLNSGALIQEMTFEAGSIVQTEWTADGQYILALTEPAGALVWQVETGIILQEIHPSETHYPIWNADASRAFLWDGTSLLDVFTGETIAEGVMTFGQTPVVNAQRTHLLLWDNCCGASLLTLVNLLNPGEIKNYSLTYGIVYSEIRDAEWSRDGSHFLVLRDGIAGVDGALLWSLNQDEERPLLEAGIACADIDGAKLNAAADSILTWGAIIC